MHDHSRHPGADGWDAFYSGDGDRTLRWSGRPNGTLRAEVAGMTPGAALDVGCGEGADAIWLARQGWQVTAVDPSRVALERAEAAAVRAGVDVAWVHAGLLEMPAATGMHDLVSVQYPALPRGGGRTVATLLAAVAPGGTLLVVHHEGFPHRASKHGVDPSEHLTPADVAAALDDAWDLEVHDVRPRPDPPPGADHISDVVMRARRRTSRHAAR